jgi:hypothetical protein
MTVRTVDNPQYELACDKCGAVFTSPRGRTAYSLRWLLARSAHEAGWETDGGHDFCPDCWKKTAEKEGLP